MGVVIVALALLAAGCYEPSLRDCTVSCTGADPCARDQVCGMDGYCVAAATARCVGSNAPIDAPLATYALHVQVMGHGSVEVAGGGTCTADCMYKLPINATVSATEVATANHAFQLWTTPNCAGQVPTCTFTLAAAQNLGAKFQ